MMNEKKKRSGLRLGLIVALALAFILSAALMPGGGYAKYRNRTVLQGEVRYLLPSVTLAESIAVTGTSSQIVTPGTAVEFDAAVSVTGRTETPSYLYIEVVGDNSHVDPANWKLLSGVTGEHGGAVYVCKSDDANPVRVFSPYTAGETPLAENQKITVYPTLIEKIDEKTAAEAYADTDAAKMAGAAFTETLVPATVSCTWDETNYTVTNTGNIDALIRATVVVNWVGVDDEGEEVVFIGETPAVTYGTDWTVLTVDGVEYCFYNGAVAPGAKTYPLITGVADAEAPDGCTLQVTVLAEAIQAEPTEAVQNAWSKTFNTGTNAWN